MMKPTRIKAVVKKPTILIADDDIVLLKTLKEFFEKNDFYVVCATTIKRARQLLLTEPLAAALIDIQFNPDNYHDRSGLKLAADTIDVSSVPKIILTVHDDYTYAVDALKPRADGKSAAVAFINKGEGLEAILKEVEQHIHRARVFLSYARDDSEAVKLLYDRLLATGLIPWMDTKRIDGGRPWRLAINKAIRESDFFVLCLSENSIERRGVLRDEIEIALEKWRGMLRNDIYIIQVRIEECEIPDDDRLQELQWIDMFDENGFQLKDKGYHQLIDAIRTGMLERYNSPKMSRLRKKR
jgi:ActR/RegA family two-component response regulator